MDKDKVEIPYVWKKRIEAIEAAPPGAGDMVRTTYDSDLDGKIANAQLTSGTDITDAITKKHANTNDPSTDQKAALSGTSGDPSVTNKYVTDNDTRNTNARTPSSHIHAQSDITNLETDLGNKLATTVFSGLTKITVGATQPTSPNTGDLWVDTT